MRTGRLVEQRAQGREERGLAQPELRFVEPPAQQVAAELEPRDAVVQVLRPPADEPGVDRLGEAEAALRDAAGRGDHDHHHDVRLQQQDLDVADSGRAERRRRHEREQPRQLREHLRRPLQRGVDLVARSGKVEREPCRLRLEPLEQAVRVIAVTARGRDPPCGRVRVREQAEPLELGELAPDRRRGDVECDALDERSRTHGLAGRHVRLDHAAQDRALALAQVGRDDVLAHLQGF
jgi:hypothetical protein